MPFSHNWPTLNWPSGSFPVSQVTPFTYRDGATYLEILNELRRYINETLHPSIAKVFDEMHKELVKSFEGVMDTYVEGIEEFRRIHDAYMADVEATLTAWNDETGTNLVNNSNSKLRQALNAIYLNKVEFGDHVEGLKNRTNADVTALLKENSTMRREFDTRYDYKSFYNTKNETGSNAYARLVAAIGKNGPIRLDENVAHTGNIANFWRNPIVGTGVITVGGQPFTVDPQIGNREIVNTIYVDTNTGRSTNDGLSRATAFDSVNTAYNTVLSNLSAQQAAGARWIVRIYGDVTQECRMYNLQRFPQGLVLQGERTNGVIQTTWRGVPGSTANGSRGLWLEPTVDTVEVRDIHFRDYNTTYGYGVYARYGGNVRVEDCQFTNCQYAAAAIQGTIFFFNNNVVRGCTNGFMVQYNGSGQINGNDIEADNRGVYVTRNVVAHVDDNTISGATIGLLVDMASRASANNNLFSGNVTGVIVRGAAQWDNNSNNFTGDGMPYSHQGGGSEARMHSDGMWTGNAYRVASLARTYGIVNEYDLSGTTNFAAGFNAGAMPTHWFLGTGKTIEIVITGRSEVNNIYIQIGSVRQSDASEWQQFVMVPTLGEGPFIARILIQSTGTNERGRARTIATIQQGNNTRVIHDDIYMTSTVARYLRGRATPGPNTNPKLTIYNWEVFFTG